MDHSRLAYRARQFWNALLQTEKRVTNEAVLPSLSPSQLVLFRRMQPSEQAHAFQVFKDLQKTGQTDPELLAAALLHDVGKILSPLSIFDRVLIVLVRHFFPAAAERWGEGPAVGPRRPFVVSACHGEWGADLVKQAGASETTIELVRRHQDLVKSPLGTRQEQLLAALQAADDGN